MIKEDMELKHLYGNESEKEHSQKFEIEYLVVNLKGILTQEKKGEFMELIQEASVKDITYLDILVLQIITDFKWIAYTRAFFV